MENKGYELWQQWMIEDSKLFEELIEANKVSNGDGGAYGK